MAQRTELIYGIHPVRHALDAARQDVLELWIQESKKDSEEMAAVSRMANRAGVNIQYVPIKTLDRITAAAAHQGVVLKRRVMSKFPVVDVDSLLKDARENIPFILVLDGLQDPHNLGACLRTADAAGVDGIVIPKDRAVPVNATAIKVASGAAEHVPVITVTNLARSLKVIRDAGIWVFGAADDAETILYDVDLTVPMALVLGAEGRGLRRNTRNHCDQLIRIPMQGKVESLNVSVAAGVCLYEAMRQRMGRK